MSFILNPYIHSKKQPNTFIGGVGFTSVTTPTDLAAKTTLSISQIKNFQVDGLGNVSCHITVPYLFVNEAFKNDLDITYYDDNLSGLLGGINNASFYGCTNLEWVKCPNATYIGTNNTGDGFSPFYNCTSLTNIVASPTQIGRSAFYNTLLNDSSDLDLSGVTALPARALYGTDWINLTFNHNSMTIGTETIWNSLLQNLYMPNVETLNQAHLGLTSNQIRLIDMRKLKNFGNPSVASNTFLNIRTGCEIRVHIDLATADAGSAHIDLVNAKSVRSCVVKFYDDDGNYVSTL